MPRIRVEEGFVQGRSDNLPKVDGFMLMEFASTSEDYISAEIRNIKADRSMRDSYTTLAIGRVCLKRIGKICTVKAEVCPEHKQHSKNYHVVMEVDEELEVITNVQCEDCAASQGGCKHALAFLMWINQKSSQPSPTEIESYWNKPKLAHISAEKYLTTKEFDEVKSTVDADVQSFINKVLLPPTLTVSNFQRYNEVDPVCRLDLHQLCLQYVKSTEEQHRSASDFREFCRPFLNEEACEIASKTSKEQSESRHWHFLRYGRISASNIHNAAHCKKENGGVLKEIILGTSTLHLSKAMENCP